MLRPEKLTLKAQEAVAAAQELAQSRQHHELTDMHLLAALIDVPDTIIIPIFQKLGARPAALKDDVRKSLDKLPSVTGGHLALSRAANDVFVTANKEADQLGDAYISAEHVLMALTSGSTDSARLLKSQGITREAITKVLTEVRGGSTVDSQDPESKFQAAKKFTIDLVERAQKGKLDPVIGRDEEIRRIIQVLCRRSKNNPVLIGEPGV
ncbi:type VI secretion system ATPase TssH, partial [bacterium]|nr:type VI secretion system ATPase TssH [bacterium]